LPPARDLAEVATRAMFPWGPTSPPFKPASPATVPLLRGSANPVDPDFGSSIRTITADGTVICDEDDVGPKGIEESSKASPEDSSGYKTVAVKCPSPKIAISGGAYVSGSAIVPEVALVASFRVQGTHWFAVAQEGVPTNKVWSLTAEAICVFP
jgi:hypothetical protein